MFDEMMVVVTCLKTGKQISASCSQQGLCSTIARQHTRTVWEQQEGRAAVGSAVKERTPAHHP